MRLSRVVLPQPLGPVMATASSGSTSKRSRKKVVSEVRFSPALPSVRRQFSTLISAMLIANFRRGGAPNPDKKTDCSRFGMVRQAVEVGMAWGERILHS